MTESLSVPMEIPNSYQMCDAVSPEPQVTSISEHGGSSGHRHLRSTGCFMRNFSHPANNTYNENNIFHSHILLSCKLFLRYLDTEFMRNTCKIQQANPVYTFTQNNY